MGGDWAAKKFCPGHEADVDWLPGGEERSEVCIFGCAGHQCENQKVGIEMGHERGRFQSRSSRFSAAHLSAAALSRLKLAWRARNASKGVCSGVSVVGGLISTMTSADVPGVRLVPRMTMLPSGSTVRCCLMAATMEVL